MQCLSDDVLRMLPLHIFRYGPQTIFHIIRNTVDTASAENLELLDTEVLHTRPKPYVHYDPDKKATYMADGTTIGSPFAIVPSMNMHVEQFDIKGSYLHENYKQTKTYSCVNRPGSMDHTNLRTATTN